jgi:hypothetical protein
LLLLLLLLLAVVYPMLLVLLPLLLLQVQKLHVRLHVLLASCYLLDLLQHKGISCMMFRLMIAC